jgi:hypothetical protein
MQKTNHIAVGWTLQILNLVTAICDLSDACRFIYKIHGMSFIVTKVCDVCIFQNVCILIGTSKLGANISRWLSKSFYKIQPWGMGPPTNSNPTRAMYATTEVSHIVICTTIVSWFALDIETMKHVSTWRICFEYLHGFASTDILVWETEPYYGFLTLNWLNYVSKHPSIKEGSLFVLFVTLRSPKPW